MDLESINPAVYELWKERKSLGSDYWWKTDEDTIDKIASEIGSRLPQDLTDFLLTYSSVYRGKSNETDSFPCRYPDKNVITYSSALVEDGSSIYKKTRHLHRPHPHFPGVGPRLPPRLLPLTGGSSGDSSILLDLRDETRGQVLFLPKIETATFGQPGYDWDNIGFVAPTFTDYLRELGTREELVARYGWPVEP